VERPGIESIDMNRSRPYWICAVVFAFALGHVTPKGLRTPLCSAAQSDQDTAAMAGIEKLHELDQRITLLNDPKALQQEWTEDAVRLEPDDPPDIGSAAIYASDVHSVDEAPGSAIVSYHPEIRDVQVAGDWAFEWGLFDVGYRQALNKPAETVHGKLLRVLHREQNGEWKFARVMVVWDSKHN
jgi:ketosteroid isomerase-like protein